MMPLPTAPLDRQRTRIYFDMDGVLADFEAGANELNLKPSEFKLRPGAYQNLPWMPHAEQGFKYLIEQDLNIWIATKIPHANTASASEKLDWWMNRMPSMLKKVIITPDKGTLGGPNDILIDDRPHKAHCENFQGTFLHFGGPDIPDWNALTRWFDTHLLTSPHYSTSSCPNM